jgi:hypothetical protein
MARHVPYDTADLDVKRRLRVDVRGENMAITLLFEPKAGADAQYDSTIADLKDEGIWPPEGLTYHVASGAGADFKVFEVWESEQHARNFGERLKPILQKHKIELSSEPRPQLVKNTIKGKSL